MRVPRLALVIGVLIFIALAVLIAALLLIAPGLLPPHLQVLSDRISLAQLFIELAGVLALLLAAFEFAQAQRRPKLRL